MVPRALHAPEVPSGMSHPYVQDTLKLYALCTLSYITPTAAITPTLSFQMFFLFMFNFNYMLVRVCSTEVVSALAV